MEHSEKESTLRIFGRQSLSTQTLKLMEQNEKLQLENINLKRKFRVATMEASLLQRRLSKIMRKPENGDI